MLWRNGGETNIQQNNIGTNKRFLFMIIYALDFSVDGSLHGFLSFYGNVSQLKLHGGRFCSRHVAAEDYQKLMWYQGLLDAKGSRIHNLDRFALREVEIVRVLK